MSISPTPEDFRAAARLTVALLDEDRDDLAVGAIIAVNDADEACRILVATAAISAASIRAAARHNDTDRLGLGIHGVAEAFAGSPA